MPVTRHVQPKAGDALLLVGTMKGAFIALRATRIDPTEAMRADI